LTHSFFECLYNNNNTVIKAFEKGMGQKLLGLENVCPKTNDN